MVSVKGVAVGALTVAACATGVALYWNWSNRRSTQSPQSPKKKSVKGAKKQKRTKSGVLKTSTISQVELPAEDVLVNSVIRSMETLQMTGNVEGELESKLVQWITSMDTSSNKFSTRTRLMCAQWIILYFTIKTITTPATDDQAMALKAMQTGMMTAWNILQCSTASQEEQAALDILTLDVAQRLRDPSKLIPAYDRVFARGDQMALEEVLVMFTTAPLLGRWKDTRSLGDRIVRMQNSLEEFHSAALQRPELPDYEVLFKLAAEQVARNSIVPSAQDLLWKVFIVRDFRIKLRSIDCNEDEKAAAVRASVSPDWQVMPVAEDTRLFRHGAIGQMLSTSAVKISMAGPWTAEDRVTIEGYADLARGADPSSGSVRQTERYEISRNDGPRQDDQSWQGSYTLTQVQQEDGKDLTIVVTFELEMTLTEDPVLSF